MKTQSPIARRVTILLMAWFFAAVAVTGSGALALLRPPFPQVVILGLLAALVLVFHHSKAVNDWLRAVPMANLVAVHSVRLVGAYFLYLHSVGRLPYAFAVPGGWGDMAVATAAIALVLFFRPAGGLLVFVWNLLGSIDILGVVATAARLALREPQSMAALLQFPLGLLPTFFVPLIIFTHYVIFVRLKDRRRNPTA